MPLPPSLVSMTVRLPYTLTAQPSDAAACVPSSVKPLRSIITLTPSDMFRGRLPISAVIFSVSVIVSAAVCSCSFSRSHAVASRQIAVKVTSSVIVKASPTLITVPLYDQPPKYLPSGKLKTYAA